MAAIDALALRPSDQNMARCRREVKGNRLPNGTGDFVASCLTRSKAAQISGFGSTPPHHFLLFRRMHGGSSVYHANRQLITEKTRQLGTIKMLVAVSSLAKAPDTATTAMDDFQRDFEASCRGSFQTLLEASVNEVKPVCYRQPDAHKKL